MTETTRTTEPTVDHVATTVASDPVGSWRATCSCGWHAGWWTEKTKAYRDAEQHVGVFATIA